MSKYSGYMDKVVILDLSTREVKNYPLSDGDREKYLGGKALAAKIASDCIGDSTDALAEESCIVIASAPLTGTGAPCTGQFYAAALSPMTGKLEVAACGGELGLYLKKAGYDALIIKGSCAELTWLEIRNDKFLFHSARSLRGMRVSAAQKEVQSAVDSERGCRAKLASLVIGPAGENLVSYATLACGERDAESCTLGSVFGAKKLKAIAIEGNKDISAADTEKAKENHREWIGAMRSHPLTGTLLPKEGTMGFASVLAERGMLPAEDFTAAAEEGISPKSFADKYNVCSRGCTYCPIKCERSVMLDGELRKGPELDNAVLFGSNIGNSDAELLIRLTAELHELGLDAADAGNAVAFAMQANAKGIWKNALRYGCTDNLFDALTDIAYKRGEGAELALGSLALGEKLGCADLAHYVNSLELSAVAELLGIYGRNNALSKLVSELQNANASAGFCRLTALADIPDFIAAKPESFKAKLAVKVLPLAAVILGAAGRLPLEHYTAELKAALDMDISIGEYLAVGRRAAELLGSESRAFPESMDKFRIRTKLISVKDITEKAKATAEMLKELEPEERKAFLLGKA